MILGEQYLHDHPGSRKGKAITYLRKTRHDFGLHRDQTIRDYWTDADLKFNKKPGPEKKIFLILPAIPTRTFTTDLHFSLY